MRVTDDYLPAELHTLLNAMMDINDGFGIISPARRTEFASEAARSPKSIREPNSAYFAAEGTQQQAFRDALGPTPPVDKVMAIVEWATYCEAHQAEEAAWNSAVHFPLLRLSVYGGDRLTGAPIEHTTRATATAHDGGGHLPGHDSVDEERVEDNDFATGIVVGFTRCTTAAVTKDYLPTSDKTSKKIEFFLHLDTSGAADGGQAQARIMDLRRILPLRSINHTDLDALLERPMTVSIGTKKLEADRGLSEAKLQVGVWHAAQWKMLDYLVSLQHQQRAGTGENTRKSLPMLAPSSPPLLFTGMTGLSEPLRERGPRR